MEFSLITFFSNQRGFGGSPYGSGFTLTGDGRVASQCDSLTLTHGVWSVSVGVACQTEPAVREHECVRCACEG